MQFGIMQGRLSKAPIGAGLQFFPTDWASEFKVAKNLGFEIIEWIFDEPQEENPIWDGKTLDVLKLLALENQVSVKTVCADFFMRKGNFLTQTNPEALIVLKNLIKKSAALGITIIGIPLVEKHLPKSQAEKKILIENIKSVVPMLEENNLNISLEVDLPVEEIIEIIDSINFRKIGVCYDTGNATTFSRNLYNDIFALGLRIKEMHIKDRIFGTTQSVYLGAGDADLVGTFKALKEISFNGPCIFQAWRESDFIGDAQKQLQYVLNIINNK